MNDEEVGRTVKELLMGVVFLAGLAGWILLAAIAVMALTSGPSRVFEFLAGNIWPWPLFVASVYLFYRPL